MPIMREAGLVLLLVSCVAVVGVVATLEDGIPRPANFADQPTTSYGPFPEVMDSTGAITDCQWYGFVNSLYSDSEGYYCLEQTRAALTNSTENPPSSLRPYMYYTLGRMIDSTNNESYCYEGCFNLGMNGAPLSSPVYAPAPYVQGPAPATSPLVSGPAMAPIVANSPYYSPSSPSIVPAPESGM